MNENDGTTTSSPGPTPATTRARCSAVVQLETATASSAPVNEANSRSNAATSGPWATQPERDHRRRRLHLLLAQPGVHDGMVVVEC